MPPETDVTRDRTAGVRHVGKPANDVIPCRLDLVLGGARPARLLVDGVERLRFRPDDPRSPGLETALR